MQQYAHTDGDSAADSTPTNDDIMADPAIGPRGTGEDPAFTPDPPGYVYTESPAILDSAFAEDNTPPDHEGVGIEQLFENHPLHVLFWYTHITVDPDEINRNHPVLFEDCPEPTSPTAYYRVTLTREYPNTPVHQDTYYVASTAPRAVKKLLAHQNMVGTNCPDVSVVSKATAFDTLASHVSFSPESMTDLLETLYERSSYITPYPARYSVSL